MKIIGRLLEAEDKSQPMLSTVAAELVSIRDNCCSPQGESRSDGIPPPGFKDF
jgi:hypothetical protein